MRELQGVARLKIHEGKLDDFKHLAAKCMDSVRNKDSGTLQYDWFFSDDHSECVVHERYRDSDALLEHTANLGQTMDALFETCSVSGEIFGTPSPEFTTAFLWLVSIGPLLLLAYDLGAQHTQARRLNTSIWRGLRESWRVAWQRPRLDEMAAEFAERPEDDVSMAVLYGFSAAVLPLA